MALGFLEAGFDLRSVPSTAALLVPTRLLGAGMLLLVVPLRLLLLVPIFRSTGAYRRWSRPEREAGVGNDSAEIGEPRLKLLPKYPLSCSLLVGRRAWHTASGLPNCTGGFSSLGTGTSAALKSGDVAKRSGLDDTNICGEGNPLGILASHSGKALRGGGRSLEYPESSTNQMNPESQWIGLQIDLLTGLTDNLAHGDACWAESVLQTKKAAAEAGGRLNAEDSQGEVKPHYPEHCPLVSLLASHELPLSNINPVTQGAVGQFEVKQ
ncbi:hypothetical protein EYF80_006713 [Liparis tanakae]|uniref:Uncharacterized protein n=1 Tax=Liparis tanakae TaxID=230148 RepID=A0A4Z2IYZ5_9TELE|nr:hypothetical protein EYF80_006713 [Liparis tanakae]